MSGTRHKVFLITGVSSGFGQSFARAALDAGHTVIGTVRSEEAREAFTRQHPTLAHGVVLDVTDFEAIPSVVARAQEAVGPVDVLVNNAGYGHEGTLEESPLEDLRRQFDVNVFGAVAMIKAVLPGMRQRRAGNIVNVTSMGGFITLPGISYYCGSKFALEGISEALAQEVKDFGIRVTAIAPGSFRTDWAGRSMVRANRSVADYDALFDPIRKARQEKSGRQAGDPARAARILLEVVEAEAPPVHLLLGTDALRLVRTKLDRLSEEIAAWEAVTRSTDFD
ncbi:putative oxidoreductase [Corallococcus coralloides DSM 2259]|uniref:Putative oxidoreductase n=1 Tax=Corallococcus coralloides (strain ATCC 25202 / DSM 2259 / NBRC 100086 / M2) TaxID=1144275 RepID=H8N0M7_CORCM|nr:oxidoreductase [Corallococcus coralloides]AFE11163.1 putative oxidoreductase [Corallococcus coralloides DSM 2259]